MDLRTEADVQAAYAHFIAKGLAQWCEDEVTEQDHVLHFAQFLWDDAFVNEDRGITVVDAPTPTDALVGTLEMELVHRNDIGTAVHWDEIVVPWANATGIAWGYCDELQAFAGAAQTDTGVRLIPFGPQYTALLAGLRNCQWARS